MKTFLEYIDAQSAPRLPGTPPEAAPSGMNVSMNFPRPKNFSYVDLDDIRVIDDINNHLNVKLSEPMITPYVALERARKVLAPYGIVIQAVAWMNSDEGEQVFPVYQWGGLYGTRGVASVDTDLKTNPTYSVYFSWAYVAGKNAYDVYCAVVTQEELGDLLSTDFDGSPVPYHDDKDSEQSVTYPNVNAAVFDEEKKKLTTTETTTDISLQEATKVFVARTEHALSLISEEGDDDPCWDNYRMVGMKEKGGREVPNCVPKKGVPKMRKEENDDAPHPKGTRVVVSHKGHQKPGRVIRHDKGGPDSSPFYIVDVGEYGSHKFMAHQVKKEDLDEGLVSKITNAAKNLNKATKMPRDRLASSEKRISKRPDSAAKTKALGKIDMKRRWLDAPDSDGPGAGSEHYNRSNRGFGYKHVITPKKEDLQEVSQKLATKAYRLRSREADADDEQDSYYDDHSWMDNPNRKKAEKTLGRIRKKFGDKAAADAERNEDLSEESDLPIRYARNHPDRQARRAARGWSDAQREMNKIVNNPEQSHAQALRYARHATDAERHHGEYKKRLKQLAAGKNEDLEVNEASKEYEMGHFKELVKKYHRARRTNPTLAREIKKLAVTHWKTNIGGSDSYPPEDSFKMNEDKSEMACNKPRAQAHGSGETGKSHVVKACSGGKEKLIRFGQLGVKGSPKKEGESEAYANRRKRFKTRHAKNIAKGKMSAAYWANKVKW